MFTVPKTLLSEAEYLPFERASEIRHEFWSGERFAMAGTSESHKLVTLNLAAALNNSLRDQPCCVYSNDTQVYAPESRTYMYPNIVVASPPIEFQDRNRDTLLHSRIVIEVLSPSTESYDRGKKFDLFRQVESPQQYVLVAQDEPQVMNFNRQSDGIAWLLTPLDLLSDVLGFPLLGLSVPLTDICRQVEFPGPTFGSTVSN